ncbi:MAG TPA: DUF933 domain-containing protein [Myxococcota bacterium]|jgi:hypothetical protein|nr:DUF933 domain-containing protein [Myxococcota bacterium]
MRVGIVGFPGSGKTSVFNALTGLSAETGYGAARGRANVGVIKVPDARVDKLAALCNPKKVTFAEISFVDYAAAAETAASGQALDPKALQELRACDAFALVVRGFETDRPADPGGELRGLEEELILGDLGAAEKRFERLGKEGKADSREAKLVGRVKEHLDATQPLRLLALTADDRALLAGFQFMSLKPLVVLLNVGEGDVHAPVPAALAAAAEAAGARALSLCAKVEMEVAELPPEEQRAFLQELGIAESARDVFVRTTYALLGLMSFLTTGPDECRAWTIPVGTIALKAAGKIHTDIERGFIRAEVMRFDDYVAAGGSEAKVKEAGKFRVEGKDYVVLDGDIVHFRFNV